MRFEICASATLLAVQLSLPKYSQRHLSPPAPVSADAAATVATDVDLAADARVEPRREVRRVEHHPDEAARLEALWLAHHAGLHPAACAQHDPVAVLAADIDHAAPGLEHVIGNRRFGIAMYGADGMLLARAEPIGCTTAAGGDQSLSLATHGDRLIAHTRDLRDDGEHLAGHILLRDAAELTAFTVDLGGDRGTRQVTGALRFLGDDVEVIYHGRQRVERRWEAVDEHCTWTLATRSVSCRTRVAERR